MTTTNWLMFSAAIALLLAALYVARKARDPRQFISRWVALLPAATVVLAIAAIVAGGSIPEGAVSGLLVVLGVFSAVILVRASARDAAIAKELRKEDESEDAT